MAFCLLEKQAVTSSATTVDNRLIFNYFPDAPRQTVAVYLMGLALADREEENTISTMAMRLNMTNQDVMDAFLYWEELGLVHIYNGENPTVTYLSVKEGQNLLRKIPKNKYNVFAREIQRIIQGRMISVAEYNEYYTFLENTLFQPDALLAVAQYCVDLKGNDIGYPYILTVARNQLSKGVITAQAVTENLNSQCKYDDDLKFLFKTLKTSRKIEHNDREMFEKWTRDMGFTFETINAVAKTVKSGGMARLDSMLEEYFRKGALSETEIAAYRKQKDEMYELAREVNRSMGVYYQSLEPVVDEYISKWLAKGFDGQTIITVAKYCFRTSVRSLQGLSSALDKFYKLGLLNTQSINGYIDSMVANDKKIQDVLSKMGIERNVTPTDRRLFKTWTEDWNIPEQLLNHCAEKSLGTTNPLHYLTRLLSDCKNNNITTVEQFEKTVPQQQKTYTKPSSMQEIEKHSYTDSQLNALFTNLDQLEI